MKVRSLKYQSADQYSFFKYKIIEISKIFSCLTPLTQKIPLNESENPVLFQLKTCILYLFLLETNHVALNKKSILCDQVFSFAKTVD